MRSVIVKLYRSVRPRISDVTARELAQGDRPPTLEGWVNQLALLECVEPRTVRMIVLSALAEWCDEQRDYDKDVLHCRMAHALRRLDHRLAIWCVSAFADRVLSGARDSKIAGQGIDAARDWVRGRVSCPISYAIGIQTLNARIPDIDSIRNGRDAAGNLACAAGQEHYWESARFLNNAIGYASNFGSSDIIDVMRKAVLSFPEPA